MNNHKPLKLSDEIHIGGDADKTLHTAHLPCGMHLLSDCGIAVCRGINGSIVYSNPDGKGTYEVRGTKTPGGDMILMFPCGEHYTARSSVKQNTMLMFRSRDGGETWQGPYEPFDIP